MTTTIEPTAAGEKTPSSTEGEPSRTCTDISIGDDRWISVTGLQELIPNLVAESLREAQLSSETCCVSIALLSGAEIQSLNKVFRGKDAATNVLSFPSASAVHTPGRRDEPVFLGDVALSFETVTSEALEQHKTALQHAAHLVVHGVLHLSGFDHGDDEDADLMEAAERTILARFGIPDPYREDDPALATAL